MDAVTIERMEATALLTIRRPERGNALSRDVTEALTRLWQEVEGDKSIRAVVLTAEGERHFCTGADVGGLQALGDDRGKGWHDRLSFSPRGANVSKPVIVAVNGTCAGGGFHFVGEADIVIASTQAAFLDPHVTVGQVAALEPITLARRIPLEAVLRMALIGRWERMSAERACQLGLVSEVVSPAALVPRSLEIAEMVARNSPAAVRATREAIWQSLERPLSDALQQGWEILVRHWDHPDQLEGPRAFAEKRDPLWGD